MYHFISTTHMVRDLQTQTIKYVDVKALSRNQGCLLRCEHCVNISIIVKYYMEICHLIELQNKNHGTHYINY